MRESLISFVLFCCAIQYVAAQTEPTPDEQTTYAPGNVNVRDVCICVVKGYCNLANANSSDDGAGGLDPRIMTTGEDTPPITGANNDTMIPTTTGNNVVAANQTTCATGLELCCPPGGYTCGVVYPPVENAPEAITTQGQALYGSFPWQAALLSQKNEYIASGVLIDQMTVLTAAHKITSVATPFKVRLGAWDVSGKLNVFKSFESNTSSIIYHPKYNPKNLKFDLAIIRLATPAPLGQVPTLTNICLASSPLQAGIRCWVSGWGKGDATNTSTYSTVMKAIDVPLVDSDRCQSMLRATRLGRNFELDTSTFICAGGEFAKDACTGDGGAPLSCSIGGYWYLAGLVSWGIGCGQANVPGVYVNIFNLTSWIQATNNNTITNNLSTTPLPTTATAPTVTTKASNSTSATTNNTTATTATTIKSNATTVAPSNSTATTKVTNATTVSSNSTATTTKLANTTASTTTTKLSNATTVASNTTITTPKSGNRLATTTKVKAAAPSATTTKVKAAAPTATTKTAANSTVTDGKKIGGKSDPTPSFTPTRSTKPTSAQTTKSNSTQTTKSNSNPTTKSNSTQTTTQASKANTTLTTTKTTVKTSTTKKVESAVKASGVTPSASGRLNTTTTAKGPSDSLKPSDIL